MMMHTFDYSAYEFRDTPAAQVLPDLKVTQAYLEEAEWNLARFHPIQGALRSLETVYMRYSLDKGPYGALHHLFLVAYSAHPLFGAHATLRIKGIVRLTHGAEEEFNAMTLASDTFAQYAFTLGEATDCADHAAECAKLAAKPPKVIQAWRNRADQLRAHIKTEDSRA
jgi:hypothetical protein